MWPFLVKHLDASKVLDLLFLSGGISGQEAEQIRKLHGAADGKKIAVRFMLGLLHKKPPHIDTLYRCIIQEQPSLKTFVMKKLRITCKLPLPLVLVT